MISVRLASGEDVPQLADLRWRLQTDDAEGLPPAEREAFIAEFASRPADKMLFHFVAEDAGRIIAAMSVRKVAKVPSPRKLVAFWGYLTNCYVLPAYRDQQVGSRLLDYVAAWARREALEMLVVWPSDRAYPFYARKGFRREPDPLVLKLADD